MREESPEEFGKLKENIFGVVKGMIFTNYKKQPFKTEFYDADLKQSPIATNAR